MEGTIKLKKPILVNGLAVEELIYNTDEITVALFSEADARKRMAAGKNISIVPSAEFDFGLHPYLGFAAVIAVNPQISFADMEQVKGDDLLEIMEVGRNFLLGSVKPRRNNSDPGSEITAEPTTPAPQTLEAGV